MKRRLTLLLIAAGILLVFVGFISKNKGKTDFEADREMIVMRQIAHRILQYAGDSTTQVAPVSLIAENKYRLPFESSFSFQPDSLVTIIGRILSKSELPSDYIVQVTEPESKKVIFGYAILGTGQESIVPCAGRSQPSKPYTIYISFRDEPVATSKWLMGAGILLLLPATFFVWQLKKKPATKAAPEVKSTELVNQPFSIGQHLFYAENQTLMLGSDETLLTVKEAKLLRIFAETPNQVIDRSRLQKEIWEDEGVIVGRSLDVFVSKLRKRLENDPGVKIVSIHGKGYRLEIG